MRVKWLDFAKGAGISLVVIYHAMEGVLNSNVSENGWVDKLAFYLSLWIIPMFFIVSGVLARRAIQFSSFKDIKPKLINWLYLYVLWSFIIYIVRLSFSHITNTQVVYTDIFKILWDPVPTIWFIYALFLSFLITWLVRKFSPVVVIICAYVINLLNAYFIDWFPGSIFERLAWIYMFYAIGYFGSNYFLSSKFELQYSKISLSVFFLSAIPLLLFEMSIPFYLEPLVSLVVSLAFIRLCVSIVKFNLLRKINGFFVYIGTISLFVYLTHFPIPSASRLFLSKLDVTQPLLIAFFALTSAYAVGHFSYLLSKNSFGHNFFFAPVIFLKGKSSKKIELEKR